MMLFPAVLMNFPNSKVCLIGERSIVSDSNVSRYKVSTFFPDSKFPDTAQNRDDFHQIRRCRYKRIYHILVPLSG